jgi:Flp pilus assembly pilin Flp
LNVELTAWQPHTRPRFIKLGQELNHRPNDLKYEHAPKDIGRYADNPIEIFIRFQMRFSVRTNRTAERGATLVERAIVVACIAVLCLAAVPALTSGKPGSKADPKALCMGKGITGCITLAANDGEMCAAAGAHGWDSDLCSQQAPK